MHLLVDKPKQVIISLHKVHNSVTLDEQIDDVRKVVIYYHFCCWKVKKIALLRL